VVDSQLRTPTSANILRGGGLIATASVDPIKTAALQAAGAEIVVLPSVDGRVDLDALLRHLAQRGTNEVHVEAGAQLSGSFIKADLVDELLLYMAPTLLGSDARGWFDGLNLSRLGQKIRLKFQDVRLLGPDLRIVVRPKL
jgi:diaminohydroxyphosphoribosylaminopyrimidine deaminase/5-amino-6-(5-phosphoribosylamino)uracil reductase